MARKSRKIPITSSIETTAPTEKPFQTAIYARLSVADTRDGDGGSLEDQIKLVQKFVEGKPDLKLSGVFSDNGKTGTNFDRGGFEAMMSEIKNGRINCIAIKDLSRFARNFIEAGNYLETIFPFLGVRVISVNDNWDSFDNRYAGDGLGIAVKNLVHDFYAKDLSRKIKTAMRIKMQNGDFIADYAPYGYKKSESNKNKLIVDEEAAVTVRNIFKWRLEGLAMTQIAKRLNDADILSTWNYAHAKGYSKEARHGEKLYWTDYTVRSVLKSIYYAGHTVNGKTKTIPVHSSGFKTQQIPQDDWIIVRNTHEAIVPEADYLAVQDLFRQTKDKWESSKVSRQKDGGQADVFKGIIFCAECGKRLHRNTNYSHKDKYARSTYCCRYCAATAPKALKPRFLQQKLIEKIVYAEIERQISLFISMQSIIKRFVVSVPVLSKIEQLKADHAFAQRTLTKITSRSATLYQHYQDGLLTADEFQCMKAQYEAEKTACCNRLDELTHEKEQYNPAVIAENKWVRVMDSIQTPNIFTGETIKSLIERIEITFDHKVDIRFRYRDAYEQLLSLTCIVGE